MKLALASSTPTSSVALANVPEKPTVEDVGALFVQVRKFLDLLPPGRMRALAITDLESCATRAVFAASENENPLTPKGD